MMSLHYPPSDQALYIMRLLPSSGDKFMLGAIYQGDYDTYKVPLNFGADSIRGSRQKYGENEVEHSKEEGELNYLPILYTTVDNPTTSQPCSQQITGFDSLGKVTTVGCTRGSLLHSNGRLVRPFTNGVSGAMHIASLGAPGSIDFVVLTTEIRSVYRYTLVRYSAPTFPSPGNLSLVKTTWLNCESPLNWRYQRTSEEILAAVASAGPCSSEVREAQSVTVLRPMAYHSVQMLRAFIQSAIYGGGAPNEQLPHRSYGELAKEATDQVHHTDVNLIESFTDIVGGETMLKKLRAFKGFSLLKKSSDAYLTVNYGILPTVDDISTLLKDWKKFRNRYYDKNGFETYHAGETLSSSADRWTHTSTRRIKVAISSNDNWFERLVQSAEEIGLMPDLNNLWEIIPFSFVVDWLVDIGGWLDSVDSRSRIYRLNIRYVTMSQKHSYSRIFDGTEFSLVGTASRVGYHRWTADHCPLPPLSLDATPTISDHWLETGALLVQRTR